MGKLGSCLAVCWMVRHRSKVFLCWRRGVVKRISPRRNTVNLRDWVNLLTTLLLRNPARQQGELRSTSCGRGWGCWNVRREDKIDPPVHTEYFLSGGATTLIFIVEGANAINAFVMRSPIPWSMVVPPDNNVSLSSQFVTIPCSMRFFNDNTPRLLSASSPTSLSF